MSTALFEVALSIKERRLELETLLQQASESVGKNERLYTAICRACCILLASHLEGFLKDLTRSLVLDFSYHRGSFDNLPMSMKRTFCERIAFFENVPRPEIDERIRQLIAFFGKNSVPIDMDAFSYKENQNKNPTAHFIENALQKIGVPSVITSLSGSKLEAVFDNEHRTNYLMVRDLRRFQSNLFHFPYKRLPAAYSFDFSAKTKKSGETIWHTLIEDIMMRRHSIVHGDTMENSTTHDDLRLDTLKLDVLMHGIMYASSGFLSK